MRFLADENFPRPALEALRRSDWDVFSIAEQCPGRSDEEVAALCADQQRILLTFDKDFGELVFRRRVSAGSGVVLFRITPESPEEAANFALALIESQPDVRGAFCVITRDRIRVRRMPSSGARFGEPENSGV
jgi:predicted nuclease of predicted toxin-antitoxin system